MLSAIPLVVLFATAFLLSRAYIATDAGERLLDSVERLTGRRCRGLLLGHLSLSAALSTILPNAVTALALTPMIPVLVDRFTFPDDRTRRRVTTGFAAATMWGANIGGMGSIVGSPANALLLVYVRATEIAGAERLNFLTWAMFGIPTVLLLCTITFLLLRVMLRAELAAALRIEGTREPLPVHRSQAQRRVFLLTAAFLAFWTTSTGLTMGLRLHDAYPAAASLAFGAWFCHALMVRRANGEPLLPLRSAVGRLPWRGLAFIALAVTVSLGATRVLGLDRAVGHMVALAEGHGLASWEIMLVLILAVGLLTEVMSNTVVALVFFPVVHGAAVALEVEPVAALVGVSLMSTVPFMSPTGAPSNAVVLGETRGIDYLLIVRLGLGLELFTAFALTMASLHVFPRVLGLAG
ncbi:SLC13 family permease [Elioraea sp.]|uniref:SLC13 family permease n=1 Tax=Elioraea sp. TaxID=2185103 RepID=UPI003F700CDB